MTDEVESPILESKRAYQRPKFKEWLKYFTNDRTAGAYRYLKDLRKPQLLTQLKDILQYVETLEETNDMIVTENKFLKNEVRTLKSELFVKDDARNMEISKRLNANKNEAYWRKKATQLSKSLTRANKVNRKLFFITQQVAKDLSTLKDFKIFHEEGL